MSKNSLRSGKNSAKLRAMTLEWTKITATELDEFAQQFSDERSFLQTGSFGEFREKLGEKNFRFGLREGKKLVAVAQIQKISARRGTFLHVAHGPLILPAHLERALPVILEKITKLGKAEKCDFIRISPLLPEHFEQNFISKKFRPAPLHINPDRTWVLDLMAEEDILLKNMRKSTRYELRQIEKNDIRVTIGNSKKDLEHFWELHEKTAARQKFVPFSRKSTELELKIWGDNCQIFTAWHKKTLLASSVILFDDHAGYYHQGASIPHKLPGAHATLWAAIREAKKRGCTTFNFWGVSPSEKKEHPWAGLSRFKRGFGGEEQKFLWAQDFAITPKYWLNWSIEKIRRYRRHY